MIRLVQFSPVNFMYCNFCILIHRVRARYISFHFCSHHLKFMWIWFYSFHFKLNIFLELLLVFFSMCRKRERSKKKINKYFMISNIFAKIISKFGEMVWGLIFLIVFYWIDEKEILFGVLHCVTSQKRHYIFSYKW